MCASDRDMYSRAQRYGFAALSLSTLPTPVFWSSFAHSLNSTLRCTSSQIR